MGIDVGGVRFDNTQQDRWAQKVIVALRSIEQVAQQQARQIQVVGNRQGGAPAPGTDPAETPTQPQGLTVTGGYSAIALRWTTPTYQGHSRTQIYRSDTDNFSQAFVIAEPTIDYYSDPVGVARAYYYWVRHVNDDNQVGPLNNTNGTLGETAVDLDLLFARLERGISATYLDSTLHNQIGLIDQLEQSRQTLISAVDDLQVSRDWLSLRTESLFEQSQANEVAALALYSEFLEHFTRTEARFTQEGEFVALTQSLTDFIEDPENGLSAAHAKLLSEAQTRQDETSALAQQISGVSTQLDHPVSGLAATRSYVLNEVFSKSDTEQAIASQTSALRADIFAPDGTSLSTAFLGQLDQALVTGTESLSERLITLSNTVTDTATGLSATQADLQQNYYNTAAVDGALTQLSTALQAQIFNGDGSALSTAFVGLLDKAIVNDNESLAQVLTVLRSDVYDPVTGLAATRASVTEDVYTQAQTDSAIASRVLTLSNKIFAGDGVTLSAGFIASMDEVLLTPDTSIGQQLSTLSNTVTDPNTGLAATRADITRDYYNKAEVGSVVSNATFALQNKIFNADGTTLSAAFVGDVSSAFSSAGQTLAQRLSTVESRSTTTAAIVQNNVYTQTEVDSVVASNVSSLRSEFITAGGQVSSAYKNAIDTAFSSNGESLSQTIVNFRASLDEAISADILEQYQTKATLDAAFAQYLSQYTVEYDGQTSTLREWAQVAADADSGHVAQWGIKTSVADVQGGVGLINDGNDVLFAIQANKLALISPLDNSVSSLFSVVQNSTDPDVPDGVYIQQGFIQKATVLDLIAGSVVADKVAATIDITAPIISGGEFNGGLLTLENNGQQLRLDPSGTFVMYYGPAGQSISTPNAYFGLGRSGRVYARDLTLYAASGEVILDSSGLDGVHMKNLSVDTLAIADNAVTVPHFIETNTVRSASTTLVNYTYDQGQGGHVAVNFALQLSRVGDVSGAFDSVDADIEFYHGSSLQKRVSIRDINGDVGAGITTRYVVPLVASHYMSQASVNIRVRVYSNVPGQPYDLKITGTITSVKK